MTTLSIYYTHKPGGLCKRLYQLLSAIQEDGHNLVHLCLDPELLPAHLQGSAHRIPFPVSQRSGLFFWMLFTLWAPCYALFVTRSKNIDRFLCFQAYYASVLLPARLVSRKPLVLFLRSLVFQINRLRKVHQPILFFADLLEKVGLRNASSLVYLTKHMQKEIHRFAFHGVAPAAMEHILPNNLPSLSSANRPSRVELQSRLTQTSEALKNSTWVLCSGVLDQRKNVDYLLEAFKGISKENRPALLIAGDGPEKTSLEDQARNLDSGAVAFLGWREDLNDWVSAADLILFPSLHEGISNALLESLALQKLILLSAIPEHEELGFPEQTYFSLQDPAHLRERVTILRNGVQVSELREKQQEAAKYLSFDWERQALLIILQEKTK